MDKLSFLYEVIENIKHISSFDLIFRLIEKRLREHFNVTGVIFCQYNSIQNKFFISNISSDKGSIIDFSIDESPFLKSIVSDLNAVECCIDNFEKNDTFTNEIHRLFPGRSQVHPIVLKDKLAGIFVVNSAIPMDNNFLYAILDIISIAFQRIVLAGHLIYTEEKEEFLEESYFKEVLQNKLFECDSNHSSLGFAVISVSYYDFHYQGHRTTANKDVFSKVYEEIISKVEHSDIILKYGSDRILIISPNKDEKSMKTLTTDIKKRSENHLFIEKTNFRGRIKVSFGYSAFPETADTLNDIYDNALIMLHENIKIENWLKSI